MLKQKSNDRAIEAVIGIQKKDSKEENMHHYNNHSDQYMPLQPAPVEQSKKKEPFQIFPKPDQQFN